MAIRTSGAMTAAELVEGLHAKKGDMIQFNVPEGFGKHHHWAIYVDDGQIIHFTTKSSRILFRFGKQWFRKSPVGRV